MKTKHQGDVTIHPYKGKIEGVLVTHNGSIVTPEEWRLLVPGVTQN